MKKILLPLILIFGLITNINAEINRIISGNESAKITIIAYESLTCSHCANFHKNVYPGLKEDFIDKGHVYIEFRNFPLDMAAMNASKIAHCRNDGKTDILHFLYKNQKKWVRGETIEDINKNLKNIVVESESGLDFEGCLVNKIIEDHVLNDRISAVKKFKIDSTPTLIINDKKFDNPQNYKKLKKTIEKLI